MRPSVEAAVRAILGSSLLGVGCGCPHEPDDLTKADFTVREGRTEELDAALQDECRDSCASANCVALTPVGALSPTRAMCSEVDQDGSVREFEREGSFDIGVPSEATCDSLCKSTPAYQAYLDAGFLESEVTVSCTWDLTGTLDDHLVDCQIGSDCSAGRRPSESTWVSARIGSARDHWIAMATLEQASVTAFHELALSLLHHGAPASLVERARSAADDETRHAAACRKLAGLPSASAAKARALRPLSIHDLARLNAREGCVLESFAAIQVAWQARRAQLAGAPVAETLANIALDEAKHAELAWDVDAWLSTQLSAAELAEVDLARIGALRDLPRYDSVPDWFADVGLSGLGELRVRARAFAAEVAA